MNSSFQIPSHNYVYNWSRKSSQQIGRLLNKAWHTLATTVMLWLPKNIYQWQICRMEKNKQNNRHIGSQMPINNKIKLSNNVYFFIAFFAEIMVIACCRVYKILDVPCQDFGISVPRHLLFWQRFNSYQACEHTKVWSTESPWIMTLTGIPIKAQCDRFGTIQ